MSGASVDPQGFVWLIGGLCQINRIPFDANLLLQQFPPPYPVEKAIEALTAFGFRVGEAALSSVDLRSVSFPCVAFKRNPESDEGIPPGVLDAEATNSKAENGGEQELDEPRTVGEERNLSVEPASRPVILVKADGDRVLYFESGSRTPLALPFSECAGSFEPRLLLLHHAATAKDAVDPAQPPVQPKFGFRWFATELLRHKRIWRDVLLASLFIQLLGLSTPLFTQVIIDKVVVHQTGSTLIVIAMGLAMFMLFNAAMNWLRQYFVLHTGNRVDAVLGSQVFRHLLRLHLPYFEQRPTGVLVARMHAVETIREFTAGAAVSLLLDFPFLLIFVAVMFYYSWQLTLIALTLLAVIALLSFAVTPLLRSRLNRQFLLGARNQAFLTEYIAGIETVKALQMEPRLESRYDDYLASYLASGFATRQLSNTYNVIANALEQTVTLAILCVGALLVMRNEGFTIGMLVAFQMFASRMSQPMLRLASLWQDFQQANIAVQRLGDIMDAPIEPHALAPSRPPEGKSEIRVADLSFRYSSDHPYLYRNLNVAIKPGRLTVLTGPSGSGKSTLAKLLVGFYQPTDGQITMDGRDIRTLSANELRQHFGIVPQETFLFSGSIYENLLAANPLAGFTDVVQACKTAEIHDVVEKLPNGYNTPIGEHGVGLSGGQKQRLAIARAVLKRPRILIFDEATSNLDPPTAERFAQTVNRLKGRITLLFIAHQLPKGLAVDEVLTLEAKRTP